MGINEATARRFETANCTQAQSSCDSDNACVAFACVSVASAGSSTQAVLYTTTSCTVDCGSGEWLSNPRLITRARYTDTQPAWRTATCHVAYPPAPSPPPAPAPANTLCSSAGYMTSSTAIGGSPTAAAWTLQAASSEADCESKCTTTAGCVAWKGNTTNWNFCYTTASYLRTSTAWPVNYTGKLKCANAASCGTFVTPTTALNHTGNSGSPWVLLPATSRANCEAQCTYDSTCRAFKGGDDTGCLLTPTQPCTDFTCYVTPSFGISTLPWETDGPDWSGQYRSGC